MKKIIFVIAVLSFVFAGVQVYLKYDDVRRHQFKVIFLDVGQGDSTLIQFRNGEKMLVDCGANTLVLSELGKQLPLYDRSIEYLVVTHPDLDHYGGCIDVVKRYKVRVIITNGAVKPNDPYWQTWDAVRQASGAKLGTIDKPATWTIASSTLRFVSPDPLLGVTTATDDSNNYSIVFRLDDRTNSFLLTADTEFQLEQALLKRYCGTVSSIYLYPCPALQSNILKIGHHGSKTSTSDEFLRAVAPRVGTISTGPNRYGHPSLRVIKRLERAGVTILRTDTEGAILIR